MTIQSQLDQVLALFDLPDTPLNGVLVAEHCYTFMKEHGPAIRAAVGGEEVACSWYQQDEGGDFYGTGCGHEFIVMEGPPTWPYCVYCAGRIEVKQWTNEDDSDE